MSYITRFLILLCGLCSFLYSAPAPLKIGMELSYPPFETIDTKGRPYGISVEIAQALGRYLQQEIQIENIPFIGLIPALNSGKIDLILSSMTVTKEREQAISFSNPYIHNGLCLLISQKSTLQNIEEANQPDRKITVKQASTGQVWVESHLTKPKITILDKESSCILEVVQGKADAFIYDQLSVYHANQKYPDATRVNLHAFQKESWAIGLRKTDTVLRERVNAFLKKFQEDGGMVALREKYLKNEFAAFNELGISFPLQ